MIELTVLLRKLRNYQGNLFAYPSVDSATGDDVTDEAIGLVICSLDGQKVGFVSTGGSSLTGKPIV